MTPLPSNDPRRHVTRSILMLLGALFLFAVLDATGKHLAGTYPIPMLVWARYGLHFLLMVALLAPRMGIGLISTKRPILQIFRATCLLSMTLLVMSALKRMPLAETTAILFAAPLMVTLMAGPVLGEKISGVRWAAVLAGFMGVLLVVRPGSGLVLDGVLLAFAGAVLFAFYQILTRRLSSTEHPVTMLFFVAVVGTVAMTLALPWYWSGPFPDWRDALLIGSLGVYGAAGHFLLTRAFHGAPASTLSPVLYAQLGWAMLIGWLAFGDFPDGLSIVGVLVIAAAGVMIAFESRRQR